LIVNTGIGYNRHERKAMYSTKEAANRMGISPDHLRHLLAVGKIEGKRLGHDWVVLELDYKRKRKPGGGRKPKIEKGGETA